MESSTFRNLTKHLTEELERLGFTVRKAAGSTSNGPVETARYEAASIEYAKASQTLKRLAAVYKRLGFKLDHLHEASLGVQKVDAKGRGYAGVTVWPVYQSEVVCVMKATVNVSVTA